MVDNCGERHEHISRILFCYANAIIMVHMICFKYSRLWEEKNGERGQRLAFYIQTNSNLFSSENPEWK